MLVRCPGLSYTLKCRRKLSEKLRRKGKTSKLSDSHKGNIYLANKGLTRIHLSLRFRGGASFSALLIIGDMKGAISETSSAVGIATYSVTSAVRD